MRTTLTIAIGIYVVILGNSCPRCSAATNQYSFTKIADDSGPFEQLLNPSINNHGLVSFYAVRDAGGNGVYVGDGGPVVPIAETGSPSELSGYPINGVWIHSDINDQGAVALMGFHNAPPINDTPQFVGKVYVKTVAGSPIVIADISQGSADGPSINNSGMVAFWSSIGTYVGDGGPVSIVPGLNGRFPAINDNGVVADLISVPGTRVAAGTPQGTTDLYDTNGAFNDFYQPVAINNSGTVAFVAFRDNGVLGVFAGKGGVPVTITDESISPMGGHTPLINDSGVVTFLAGYNGGTGIFTGPDPIQDRVAGIGDAMFGSTVSHIFIDPQRRPYDLNNMGQIAFAYTLEDGRQGIAVATYVPEPPALARS